MPAARAERLSRLAVDAYIYLYPLLLTDATRRVYTNVPAGVRPGMGPANSFGHMRAFPPGDFREVVRPNYDTLYSILWFDVRDEPLVVTVPDTSGRYYMLPMLDMWSDVFAVVGSRTTGTGEGDFAIVAPGWDGDLPTGVERIDAPTALGWTIGRTKADGPADYEAVNRIQDGFRATPLSRWPAPSDPADVEPDPTVDMSPPDEQVANLTGRAFLARAAELLAAHPTHLVDQPMLARLPEVGLRPGEPFDADALDELALSAVDAAPKQAQARMRRAEPRMTQQANGWSMPVSDMGVYGTNYLRRAIVAKVGLGANLPEDAVYPVLYTDEHGERPIGEHDYVLHFDADALPPADAFWSVTMYDGEGFPVPNDLDRYALGDRDDLRYNPDGSLDLYLQRSDPGGERSSNWLPTPSGPIGVTLRLYDPRPEVLDMAWTPPPLTRA